MLTQEEKFNILSKCNSKKEYTDLYMELFPNDEMIYLFTEDFTEAALPYK